MHSQQYPANPTNQYAGYAYNPQTGTYYPQYYANSTYYQQQSQPYNYSSYNPNVATTNAYYAPQYPQNYNPGFSHQNAVYPGVSQQNVYPGVPQQNVYPGVSQQNVYPGYNTPQQNTYSYK
jgi:hypothetical protein